MRKLSIISAKVKNFSNEEVVSQLSSDFKKKDEIILNKTSRRDFSLIVNSELVFSCKKVSEIKWVDVTDQELLAFIYYYLSSEGAINH